jgi:hypothetical protein
LDDTVWGIRDMTRRAESIGPDPWRDFASRPGQDFHATTRLNELG